jgi:hypothetical protein
LGGWEAGRPGSLRLGEGLSFSVGGGARATSDSTEATGLPHGSGASVAAAAAAAAALTRRIVARADTRWYVAVAK